MSNMQHIQVQKQLEQEISQLQGMVKQQDSDIFSRDSSLAGLEGKVQNLDKVRQVLEYKWEEAVAQLKPREQAIADLEGTNKASLIRLQSLIVGLCFAKLKGTL